MNSPQPSSGINGGGCGPHPSWGEHLAVIVPSLILVEEQSRIPDGPLGLLYWGIGLEYDRADPQTTSSLTNRLAPGSYLTEW